jgi:hypothetical protein
VPWLDCAMGFVASKGRAGVEWVASMVVSSFAGG